MIHRLPIALFLFVSFFIMSANAQTSISGKVLDSDTKEPIVGASVRVEGKRISSTDATGVFKLNVEDKNEELELTVFYLGYKTNKQTINPKSITQPFEVLLQSQTIQLNEVVTASFYKKNAAKESVSMEVITKSQIQNTNANDLGDIVSKTPGVVVQDGQISIRGGSSFSYGVGSRTAILVDGIGFTSPDLGQGQNNFVPIENVKQVEIIKGASSVVYGSSALNGIVNLITEWPKQSESETSVDLNTAFFDQPKLKEQAWWVGGTPFVLNVNVNHQRKIKDLQLVAGGNITSNKSYLQDGNEFRFRYFAKTRHLNQKIPGLNYGVNFYQMYERTNLFFIGRDMDTNAIRIKTGSGNSYLRTSIDPHLTYQNTKGHRFSLNMRYVNFYRTEVSDVSATSHGLDVQPQYQWTFKNILVLTTGLPFGLGFSKSNLYPGTRTNYNAAAFVQAEVNWKRLSWTGGARYEVIGVDVFRETTKPVFRTGLNFRAGKATFLRTSWGQGYRVPTIGERFISAEFSTGIYVIPNRNLLTETGWSFELGLKQGFQINKTWKGYFDFAYFWQEYLNFVQYDLGIFPNKYEDGSIIFPNEGDNIVGMRASNIENARVSGYEVSIVTQGKIGNVGLNMLVGYTYTYPTAAADTTSDPNYDIRRPGTYLKKFFELNGRTPDSLETTQLLQYRNRHLFRADIEATYWKAYVGVSMFYGSFPERIPPLFLAAAIFLFDGGQRSLDKYNAQHRNGDFVFDLRAGVNITPKLKVGFIVKNVTNHFYALRPGRPEPHRNFTAQIRYTF